MCKATTLMPMNSCDCLRAIANASTAMAISRGDRLQPCHVPLPREKYSDCCPFVITEGKGWLFHSRDNHWVRIFLRVINRYCHSTWLNAFSESIDMTTSGECSAVQYMTLKRHLRFELACLFRIKQFRLEKLFVG